MDRLQDRRAELNKLAHTFNTDGWAVYQKDLKELRDTLVDGAPYECLTAEQWTGRRATIHNLDTLLNYQPAAELELEEIERILDQGGHSEWDDSINILEE